jgi:cytochrome c oxidase assembly protein subunit 15
LLWTGFELISPPWKALELREISSSTTLKEVGQLRRHFQGAMGIFLTTVVAGTIVAGIDAGRKYHTFPKMEGRWIPEGIWDLKPARRNFFENIGLTQWDHRLLAVSTLAAYSAVYYKARMPQIWKNLPEEAKMALNLSIFAVGGQVLGGVTAVKNAVPTTLAMLHESGAVLILASSLWTLYSLRFARPILLPSVTEGLKAASKII